MSRAALSFLVLVLVAVGGARLAAAEDATGRAPEKPAATGPATVVDEETVRAIHAAGTSSSCEACHTEDAWLPARFAHERTGFPLDGGHTRARCASCHARGFEEPLSSSCASCHQDVHRQELGLMCASCHSTQSWASRFPVDAHRRTGFPLSGRHAFLPCEECHGDRRDLRFTRAPLDCVDCHRRDADRTVGRFFDHVRNQRTGSCQGCHDPWSWQPARMLEHERCFTLTAGPHRGVSCRECHAPLTPVVNRGTCRTETVQCASCHVHQCDEMNEEHDDVPGYRCASLACAQCHGGSSR